MKGESTDEYITVLYSLVETCEYGTLKQEMLRDRLVISKLDAKIQGNFQINVGLTLDKTKTKGSSARTDSAVACSRPQGHGRSQELQTSVE